MRLKTASHNRKRAYRRVVLKAAFEFDMAQIARLSASGRLDKRRNSGFVRRSRKRAKWVRIAAHTGVVALTPPTLPWFRSDAKFWIRA